MEEEASEEEMGDGGSAPSPFIARGGQPAPPTITGNDGFPCMSQGLVKAFGARGAPYLTLGFASKPSPSAPWARGLLSAFWERGSPDLPACGPWRGCASRSVWPIIINKAFKTLARGQA